MYPTLESLLGHLKKNILNDEPWASVTREATINKIGAKVERETDMLCLGLYLVEMESKHPKHQKHVCWRGRREEDGWLV